MPENSVFRGCISAIMAPCSRDGVPTFDALVKTTQSRIAAGMGAVAYCGSKGDWPLLSEEQRQESVPVVVGTGAQSPQQAAAHTTYARKVAHRRIGPPHQ